MNNSESGVWGIIGYGIAMLVAIDVLVVLFTMLQIGSGVDTPHIAFWDAQIRFVVSLISK